MRPSQVNESACRDARGRFTANNRYGTASHFEPGQCGNRWGRPVPVQRWVERFHDAELDEPALRQAIDDTHRPPHARIAARRLLVDLVVHRAIPGIDPERARHLFYRTGQKNTDDLRNLLLNERADPNRREAARLRLMPRSDVQ